MAMNDNMMDLALRITADPSQAEAAVKEFAETTQAAVGKVSGAQAEVNATAQAMQRTIAQSLQQQGASAEEAAQIYKQMGISGQQAGAEIQAAFGEAASTGAQAQQAAEGAARGTSLWHTMNQGVIGDLRLMRYSLYAFTTPMMFTYIIPQIETMVNDIREGISAMEGFDDASQKAFADLVKGADEALTKFQGLTTAQKIWQGYQLAAQTQARINADIAAREAIENVSRLRQAVGFLKSLMDIGSGNYAGATLYYAQFGVKAGASSDELKQVALLTKQEKELATLEKQLRQEQAKGVHTVNELARATGKLADEEQRFQARGMLFNLRVGAEFTKAQTSRATALGAQRYAGLAGAVADYEAFTKAAASEEARAHAESLRREQQYFRSAEHNMQRHAQTIMRLQREMSTGGSFAGVSFQAVGQTFEQFNAGLRQVAELSGVSIQPLSRMQFQLKQVRQAADMAGMSFQSFSTDIGRNAAQAIVYGASFGKAMEAATKATVAQIAAQSFIWAMYYTAHGIADIFWNPPRAVADFAAAAEFAAIGGAAAAVGAAIPGGGSHAAAATAAAHGGSPQSGLGGSPGLVGSEAPYGGSSEARGPHTTVNIYGARLINTRNLQDLIEAMNQGGHAGTIRLNIAGGSHTLPNPVY